VDLNFTNCFKLNQETRRDLIQQSFFRSLRILPGREVPETFNHQAKGNVLTIRPESDSQFSASSRFKACFVISPTRLITGRKRLISLLCRLISKNGDSINEVYHCFSLPDQSPGTQSEHLCLFHYDFHDRDRYFEVDSEILFEFSCTPSDAYEIVQCGVGTYGEEIEQISDWSNASEEIETENISDDVNQYRDRHPCKSDKASKEANVKGHKRKGFWSWLRRR
jgi:hypothetical protein